MKVIKSHRTPLMRQVAEGVEIATCQAEVVMNSKGEWNGSRLPRMVIERGEKIDLDEGDVNIRMMNWESREPKNKNTIEITRQVTRKRGEGEDDEESGSVSEKQVGKYTKRRKVTELTEERKQSLDHHSVLKVKGDTNQITSYFEKEVVAAAGPENKEFVGNRETKNVIDVSNLVDIDEAEEDINRSVVKEIEKIGMLWTVEGYCRNY